MSTFVIRNQGFFYTDEYFAPIGEYKQIVKRTFATREAADQARSIYVRSWIRQHPMGDFLFDDRAAVEKVVALFRERWPAEHEDLEGDDLYEVHIPKQATDDDVDAILDASGLELAKVFELQPGAQAAHPSGAEESDVELDDEAFDQENFAGDGEDDEDFDEDEDFGDPEGEIFWGPIERQQPFRMIIE